MAVTFKTDQSYGFSLLSLFGVDASMISAAVQQGLTVEQSSPGHFVIRSPSLGVLGTVQVKGQTISLAKAGQLGPASKTSLKFQFEAALNKGLSSKPAPGVASDPGTMSPVLQKADPQTTKTKVDSWVSTPPTGLGPSILKQDSFKSPSLGAGVASSLTNSPVPLEEAKVLLQPVYGTSGNSIYFVVAMLKGCNLAIRIKGGTLSVRVAGMGSKAYVSALSDLGFDSKGQHLSSHYAVGSTGLLHKTLGAILGRIGFANILSVADLSAVPKVS